MSRITLAASLGSRDGTFTKDALLQNCFVEASGGDSYEVLKRPGTVFAKSMIAGASQGMFKFGSLTYAISSDTLQPVTTAAGEPNLPLPGVTISGQAMQCIDATYLPSGTSAAITKSTSSMWVMLNTTVGGIAKVTSANFPAATVPGVAVLDQTYYVMDIYGNVYNSAVGDPMTWTALGFVGCDPAIGIATALTRHLNYLLCFGDLGMQVFYDAGNAPPGSPLAPVPNAFSNIGCASSNSIVHINDNTLLITKSAQHGRSVSIVTGLSLSPVSTPVIEKFLNNADLTSVRAFGLRIAGHLFYVVNCISANRTIVYDMSTKQWCIWGFNGGNVWNYNYATNGRLSIFGQDTDLVFEATSGKIAQMNTSQYSDDGTAITVQITTPILDGSTYDRKFLPAVNLIGDTASTTVALSYSDDDYTTYSTAVNVDMSTVRKQARRLGSFRRRSFRLVHTDTTPLRLKAIDLVLQED